jgi:hypothetical protein
MTLLTSISRLDEHRYAVTLEVDGTAQRMVCHVRREDGIEFVQSTPDLTMSTGLSPRLLAAALCAFDAARWPPHS